MVQQSQQWLAGPHQLVESLVLLNGRFQRTAVLRSSCERPQVMMLVFEICQSAPQLENGHFLDCRRCVIQHQCIDVKQGMVFAWELEAKSASEPSC